MTCVTTDRMYQIICVYFFFSHLLWAEALFRLHEKLFARNKHPLPVVLQGVIRFGVLSFYILMNCSFQQFISCSVPSVSK
jgi:hypothetical protein